MKINIKDKVSVNAKASKNKAKVDASGNSPKKNKLKVFIKRGIFTVLILLLLASTTIGGAFWYLNSAPSSLESTSITIEQGAALRSAANKLQSDGIIRNADFFILLAYLSKQTGIRSGRYNIYSGSSSTEILKKINTGTVVTHRVTFPEGSNMYQIAEMLETAMICNASDFLQVAKDVSFLESIGINAPIAEGYIFPDTYVFAEGSDPKDIIAHSFERLKNVVIDIAAKYDRSPKNMTLHKMLTLASIVEKESANHNESKKIAAVFHNRLESGWRIDSCATVWYALGKYDGGILTFEDLKIQSPYNTYLTTTLPPTPIASPGRVSIEATMFPDPTPYMFFVSRNDGTHYFSQTLYQHERAADFYQRNINNGFIDDQR